MVRFFICFLFFIIRSALSFAQDDTIGFWKITENGKEISPVTLNNEPSYLIEALSDSTVLNVYYYTESPCEKCMCKLQVRDTDGVELKTVERKGYGNNVPFPFSGKDLKVWLAGGKGKIYMYFSGRYDGWMPWVFLGAVKCDARPPVRR